MCVTLERNLLGCVEGIRQGDSGNREELSFKIIDLGDIHRQYVR